MNEVPTVAAFDLTETIVYNLRLVFMPTISRSQHPPSGHSCLNNKKCQWVQYGNEACNDLVVDNSPDFCEMKITRVSKDLVAMIGRDGYSHRWTARRNQFVKVCGRFNESSKSLVERLVQYEIYPFELCGLHSRTWRGNPQGGISCFTMLCSETIQRTFSTNADGSF